MSLPTTHSYQEQTSGPQPWDHIAQRQVDDPPNEGKTREEAFGRENAYALPVNQRSARHWSGHTLFVDGTTATRILPSQKGRRSVTILVPASAAAAIYIDESESTLESPTPIGFYLAVGASMTVDTEASICAISATAGTDTTVCVATTWG